MSKIIYHRLSGYTLLSIFIGAIYLPFTATFFSRPTDISLNEKRQLSKMPELKLSTEALSQFPRQFEAFFKDHFGLRNQFINLHHQIMVNFFHTSPVDKIILGKDEYLFYRHKPEKTFEDLQGQFPFSIEELENWKRILENKNEWLNSQGITYLLAIAPNKHTLYSEKIPKPYLPQEGTTRLDQFISYMEDNSHVPILDLRPPLFAAKTGKKVYYKSDTHWNDRGSFIVYQEIINKIGQLFPGKISTKTISVTSREGIFKEGDLSLMLGMPERFQENTEFLNVTTPNSQRSSLKINTVPVKDSFTTTHSNAAFNAVIFRDSFFTRVAPFISEHFSRADYIWNNFNHIILKELIHKNRPDIVIEEKAERLLAFPPLYHEEKIHNDDPLKFKKEKQLFQQTKKSCLSILPENGNRRLHGMNDLVVKQTGEGLILKSIGSDPFFFLPRFKFNTEKELVIKIRLQSPMYNDLQVYYATKAIPQYRQEQSIHRTIKQGLNDIYLALPGTKISERMCLRVDMGGTTGEFTLHSLEIRQ